MQVVDEILEPGRFEVLLDGSLGLKFKISLLLGNGSFGLLLLLFSGNNNLGFSGLGSILLLVKIAVRDSSEFSEFLSSLLASGFLAFE